MKVYCFVILFLFSLKGEVSHAQSVTDVDSEIASINKLINKINSSSDYKQSKVPKVKSKKEHKLALDKKIKRTKKKRSLNSNYRYLGIGKDVNDELSKINKYVSQRKGDIGMAKKQERLMREHNSKKVIYKSRRRGSFLIENDPITEDDGPSF
jgi:hypothetical protein